MTRLVGLALAKALFPVARPFAFVLHSVPMNRVRRAYQLRPLGWDVRRVYCDGDLTLYADLPELIPISGNPPTHRYIGPVVWSPSVESPACWHEAISGPPPTYVSLRSSGRAQLLPMVIEALVPLEQPIVCARPAQRRCGKRPGVPWRIPSNGNVRAQWPRWPKRRTRRWSFRPQSAFSSTLRNRDSRNSELRQGNNVPLVGCRGE